MEDKENVRAFIYTRVSTLEQAQEGYSIGAQEKRLRAYAEARGYEVIKVYSDPAYSGANMDRPALQKMLEQVEQGVVDAVLVYKLDRLSRSQKDTLYMIEEVFIKHEVAFVSMSESFDTSTPFGRAMVGILSVFAQLEREQIKERFMLGKQARAEAGLWHAGGGKERDATGYDYVPGEGLVVNEYEAACVRFIIENYLQGNGVAKIHKAVMEKFPGVLSSETTVRNVITNPLYTGKVSYRGEYYEGVHEPLITEEEFKTAQELLKKRATNSRPFHSHYLLTGVIRCGECGARMAGTAGALLKSGERMRYYVCHSRRGTPLHMVKDPNCKKLSERKERIEEKVIGEIKKINLRTFQAMKPEEGGAAADVAVYEEKIKAIDRQISKLIDLYTLEDSPLEMVSEKIEKLKREKDGLKRHLEELTKEQEESDLSGIIETVSQLSTFDWDNEETERKRLIVAKLINTVAVSNDNITIDWAF